MILSKQILSQIKSPGLEVPPESYFDLPEKVLQFGTGVLLRGLPDYFIDKANKQGVFNGRIVVVKSTGSGGADAFGNQDGLYTLCIRGIEEGNKVQENKINASISRILSAKTEWDKILECAANPHLQVVISNTTEVGIVLVNEDVYGNPPESFPAKLLAFLYKRFQVFHGATDKGMVIIPTELIPDNGDKLEAIVEELAHLNKLEYAFLDWLENCNYFCNSLVDRIVPGKLPEEEQEELESRLGYKDELMIMSEVYRLWAIETSDPRVKDILSFANADKGVVIAPDIHIFRELKLRLLNGSHTFSCGLAHLAGFTTVKEAMNNAGFSFYIRNLMMEEIAPAITSKDLTLATAQEFASSVLDRYNNPYIEHSWLGITLQYSSKMKMRNVPLIVKYYERFGTPPQSMALGFAAHLLFMRPVKVEKGRYGGIWNGRSYPINDDNAKYYYQKWENDKIDQLVQNVLSDTERWDTDLTRLPGFEEAVKNKLNQLLHEDAKNLIHKMQLSKLAV